MTDSDGERWTAVDAVFAEALEVPEAERTGWLRRRCGDDLALLREVEGLLSAEAQPDFLGTRSGRIIARTLSSALEGAPGAYSGSDLGPYRLGRLIGRGGMADVYEAERVDGAFRKRVAVKVQRRGLGTDDVLARFRAERQILSGLGHPNIARLLDGGATNDGVPYLVMEFVDGVPITEYCDQHDLPVSRRLELFSQVARAVQAAHAMLVVHRDIKPSNVLVTEDGRVKLLDFGIAKLLDPAALPGEVPRTRTGSRPLTPEYASPEQVLGDSITTASDIYQLGLLLFRILTGGHPFAHIAGSGRRLEDAITGTEPSLPSDFVLSAGDTMPRGTTAASLTRRLRGDLDTIVSVALRKQPERRYPSAHEMAEDVRRHLEGRPVWARRDSRAYRVGKFLKRNPLVAPVAVALAIAGSVYVGTLQRHGHEMELQRNVARMEAERARTTEEFLVGLFQSADPLSPVPDTRQDVLVRDVMEEGARRARTELAAQPELQTLMLSTIGDVFLGLGDAERAVTLQEEAYAIAVATFGKDSREAARARLALVEPTLQLLRREPVPADSGVHLALRALVDVRRAFGERHRESAFAELALANSLLFSSYQANADEPVGEILIHHALGKLDDLGEPAAVQRAAGLLTLTRSVHTRASARRSAHVADYAREAVEAHVEAYGPDHPRTWSVRLWRAAVIPDTVKADSLRLAAIHAFEAQLGPQHDLTIGAHQVHALALNRRGNYGAAADYYAVTVDRRLARGDARDAPWFVTSTRGYGDAARTASRYEEAERAFREATEAQARIGAEPAAVASIRIRRAWTLIDLGRPTAALEEALRARREAGEHGRNALYECVLARAFRANGRPAAADSVVALAAEQIAETGYHVRDYHPCWGITPST